LNGNDQIFLEYCNDFVILQSVLEKIKKGIKIGLHNLFDRPSDRAEPLRPDLSTGKRSGTMLSRREFIFSHGALQEMF
jgi:hypothetical protein